MIPATEDEHLKLAQDWLAQAKRDLSADDLRGATLSISSAWSEAELAFEGGADSGALGKLRLEIVMFFLAKWTPRLLDDAETIPDHGPRVEMLLGIRDRFLTATDWFEREAVAGRITNGEGGEPVDLEPVYRHWDEVLTRIAAGSARPAARVISLVAWRDRSVNAAN